MGYLSNPPAEAPSLTSAHDPPFLRASCTEGEVRTVLPEFFLLRFTGRFRGNDVTENVCLPEMYLHVSPARSSGNGKEFQVIFSLGFLTLLPNIYIAEFFAESALYINMYNVKKYKYCTCSEVDGRFIGPTSIILLCVTSAN